jgi:hypothetical protein
MPRSHYPRGRNPGVHWIEGWKGPRDSLDVLEKRKISCSYRDSSPGPSCPWPSRYSR